MDKNAFDQIVDRLKEANAVIEKLDPGIRADAFKLLQPYVSGRKLKPAPEDPSDDPADEPEDEIEVPGPDADEDELVEKFESDKDADNALLSLAITLKRHGRGPLDLKVLKGIASELNLDIPARLDKTFVTLKRDGTEVLRKQSDGWKITPTGEKWLKKTYGVERGKQPLP